MAARPASMLRLVVVPPMCRRWMPVRSTIHSLVVPNAAAMSSLETTRSGRAVPHPVIDPVVVLCSIGMSGGSEPGNRLLWSESFTGCGDEGLQFSVEGASDVVVADRTDDGSGCDVSSGDDRCVGLEDSGGRTDDQSFESLEPVAESAEPHLPRRPGPGGMRRLRCGFEQLRIAVQSDRRRRARLPDIRPRRTSRTRSRWSLRAKAAAVSSMRGWLRRLSSRWGRAWQCWRQSPTNVVVCA